MVTLINGVRRGKLRKDEDTMPIVAVYFSLLEALLEVYYLKLVCKNIQAQNHHFLSIL